MLEKFYLEGYEGTADCSHVVVPINGSVRLPDQPCKFVRLARWNVSDDEAFTVDATGNRLESNNEIYYGFGGGKLFGQLYISDTSDLIPVSNCKYITVRSTAKLAAPVRVYFSWYW